MIIWLIIAEDMGELVMETSKSEMVAKSQEMIIKAHVTWNDILQATKVIEKEYTHKPWH